MTNSQPHSDNHSPTLGDDTDANRRPTRVPDGEEPVVCPYCDRPFPTSQLRDLHMGETHKPDLNEVDRKTYEDARDEEGDDLFLFHLKVIGGIMAIYAAMVVLYIVVLSLQG